MMFVDIDGTTYSKYSIQSFYSKNILEDGVLNYCIVYYLVSGVVLVESFNSDSERNVKLNELEGV